MNYKKWCKKQTKIEKRKDYLDANDGGCGNHYKIPGHSKLCLIFDISSEFEDEMKRLIEDYTHEMMKFL